MWTLGYFYTVRKMSNAGVASKRNETIIAPPKWLYYLCGAPASSNYPRGTMRVMAFGVQMMGLVWALWAIWDGLWKPSHIESLISFAFCTILVLIITEYAYRHYAFREKKRNK